MVLEITKIEYQPLMYTEPIYTFKMYKYVA